MSIVLNFTSQKETVQNHKREVLYIEEALTLFNLFVMARGDRSINIEEAFK